jgi:hypothetical protein
VAVFVGFTARLGLMVAWESNGGVMRSMMGGGLSGIGRPDANGGRTSPRSAGRWLRASRVCWAKPVTRGNPDDPTTAFRIRLRQVYQDVRSPSYRMLRRHASFTGLQLATSTLGDLLSGRGIPRWETVEAFIRACERCAVAERLVLPKDTFDLRGLQADYRRMASAAAGRGGRGGRAAAGRLAAEPRELPADTRHFTGRRRELAHLLPDSRGTPVGEQPAGGVVVIWAVNGMAGVGKPKPGL